MMSGGSVKRDHSVSSRLVLAQVALLCSSFACRPQLDLALPDLTGAKSSVVIGEAAEGPATGFAQSSMDGLRGLIDLDGDTMITLFAYPFDLDELQLAPGVVPLVEQGRSL